jgi:hypothetical protein
MLSELDKLRAELIVQQSRFVRMNANSCVYKRVFVGYFESRRVRAGCDFAIAYAHDDLDSGFERALDDGFAVSVELCSLNVRV